MTISRFVKKKKDYSYAKFGPVSNLFLFPRARLEQLPHLMKGNHGAKLSNAGSRPCVCDKAVREAAEGEDEAD